MASRALSCLRFLEILEPGELGWIPGPPPTRPAPSLSS